MNMINNKDKEGRALRPANRSAMSKYARDEHKRAAKALGYGLTLGDSSAWFSVSAVWQARLTPQEAATVPEHVFITEESVRKACLENSLSDWSAKSGGNVDQHEAEVIRKQVGAEALDIPLEAFRIGLEIELEHGTRYPDANINGNHPIATGLIVLAHLKESLDYYTRLQCMELEMELDDALASGDADCAFEKRRALAEARSELEGVVSDRLKPDR